MIPQLTNNLKQAEHHLNKGSEKQAVKHLENFIKHLNNEALKENVTDSAKEKLNKKSKWYNKCNAKPIKHKHNLNGRVNWLKNQGTKKR